MMLATLTIHQEVDSCDVNNIDDLLRRPIAVLSTTLTIHEEVGSCEASNIDDP